jgi:hypothetical protein
MDSLNQASHPPSTISMARLFKIAFDGCDLKPLRAERTARIESCPNDAAALMDLCVIEQLLGNQATGLRRQAQALSLDRLYRSPWPVTSQALRVLAFKAPGDVGTNTPIEFLLDGSDVVLYTFYVVPGRPAPNPISEPIPEPIPEHDIAIVLVCDSDSNRPVLREIELLIPGWPCPVLNQPAGIFRTSREQMYASLKNLKGVQMPATVRVSRDCLQKIATGFTPVHDLLREPQAAFPLIVRPVDSHAGRSLAKLDAPASIAAYLANQQETEFFISRFVDYRGADGLFRKYRIIWVDGQPYPVHMAICEDWKVWYYNAGMATNAAKRDEEARFMAAFDDGFARRHSAALAAIAGEFRLEYFGIDCAETTDGELLVFEGGVDLVAHDMDRPDVYPYKSRHMQKLFAAFRAMLKRKSVAAWVTA